jgi:shikimate kinase
MEQHVYLIGMPGSGKTSVGKALAKLLAVPFVDLDDEVERTAGKPVVQIFRDDGEARFRELEHEVVARVASGPPSVVACGGGAVLRDDNRELIGRTGTVVWLQASPEKLWNRIKQYPRPLARGPVDVKRIERERRDVYRSVAAHRVASEGEPDAVARKVAEVLG